MDISEYFNKIRGVIKDLERSSILNKELEKTEEQNVEARHKLAVLFTVLSQSLTDDVSPLELNDLAENAMECSFDGILNNLGGTLSLVTGSEVLNKDFMLLLDVAQSSGKYSTVYEEVSWEVQQRYDNVIKEEAQALIKKYDL